MGPGFDAAGGGVQRVRGDAHLDETLDEFHLHQVSAPSAQEPRGHRSGAHRHRVLDGVHVRLRGAERDSRVRRRADRGGGSAQPLLLRRRCAAPVDQKLRLRSGVYFFDVFRRVRGVGGVSPALLRAAHVADAHVHAQPLRVDSVRGGDEDGPVGVLRGGGEATARVIHPALRLRHVFLRVRGLLPRDSGGHRIRDGRRGRHHEHL